MATPKATTLQERFGFKDDDMKKQTHDDIMQWADSNAHLIIDYILAQNGQLKIARQKWQDDVNRYEANVSASIAALDAYPSVLNAYRIKLDEYHRIEALPFIHPDRGIRSYADIFEPLEPVRPTELPSLPKERWEYPEIEIAKKIWEYAITTNSKFVVGFVDLIIFCRIPCGLDYGSESGFSTMYTNGALACEIKTVLPTAGELIRQIRMYQEHLPATWCVISPDDRHAAILESQGIYFYKAPF